MDILRLGPYNNVDPTYTPDTVTLGDGTETCVIEGFSSKIWTERFLRPGEFEFKTPFVNEMMDILPEKTFISHRHTREVMQVETHSISQTSNGTEELTIKGRTLDKILESRYVEGRYNKRRKMNRHYTEAGAALVLIWNSVANDGAPPLDVTRIRKDGEDNGDQEGDGPAWPWTAKDKLPNVIVTDSTVAGVSEVRRWWLKEGMLYDQLVRIMEQGDLGLRIIRPPTATVGSMFGGVGERVSVRSDPLNQLGEIIRTTDYDIQELRFDVYKGVDRSVSGGGAAQVVFSVMRDDFGRAEHLYSIADWKTALEVRSSLNRKWDIYRSGQAGYTGWDRLVFDMDAGAPDIPDPPDKPGKNASQTQKDNYEEKYDRWIGRRNRVVNQFEEDYKKDGKKELKARRKVYLFSGDISADTDIHYQYGVHYSLGDKVTLAGRDGTTTNALISEYTLTEDADGERGFPGLELLED